jgi:hypothetical protein
MILPIVDKPVARVFYFRRPNRKIAYENENDVLGRGVPPRTRYLARPFLYLAKAGRGPQR